jgi:nucleoside-diphosphate-sugar epimerase
MKMVVTGVAGFIGSHLAEKVLSEGHDVIGIDCFTDYYSRELKENNLVRCRKNPRFNLHKANISEADLIPALENADIVYHLAAQAGVRTSWGDQFRVYSDYNILGTQRILEAALLAGVRRVVYASSSSVYGDADAFPMSESVCPRPVSPYGVSKLAAEHLCVLYSVNYGLSTVSLRYFTVYGPRQRPDMAFHKFIRAFLENRQPVLYGDGNQTRDFTYIADAVDATYKAGLIPGLAGRILNIGGGSRISLNDVITILEDLLGAPVNPRKTGIQKGDVRHTAADITAAATTLGYAPGTPLKEGLANEIDWLKSIIDGGSNDY